MSPWTSSLFAPLNVNDSKGCMLICDNTASFMCVTSTKRSSFAWPVTTSTLSDFNCPISVGARIDALENQTRPFLQTKSSALHALLPLMFLSPDCAVEVTQKSRWLPCSSAVKTISLASDHQSKLPTEESIFAVTSSDLPDCRFSTSSHT